MRGRKPRPTTQQILEGDPGKLGVHRLEDTMRMANLYGVTRDHFQAMGIPLVRGRSFRNQDTEKSQLVAVIDQDSARTIFPGQDPIGKYLQTGLWDRPVEIVGIAGRVKHSQLDPDAAALQRAQLYFPIAQIPDLLLPLAANTV